jgi:hypothetical protein
MSLAKLLAPPRTDVIPGRRLAPRCTLGAIAAAEEFFVQHHVALAVSGGEKLPESAQAAVRSYAAADAARWFRYGNSLFAGRILSGRGRVLTVCLALRDGDPACRDVTWEVARDLAATADEACLDEFIRQYWGFERAEKKVAAPSAAETGPPAEISTGAASSGESSIGGPAGPTATSRV